jgi:hypothetical protein
MSWDGLRMLIETQISTSIVNAQSTDEFSGFWFCGVKSRHSPLRPLQIASDLPVLQRLSCSCRYVSHGIALFFTEQAPVNQQSYYSPQHLLDNGQVAHTPLSPQDLLVAYR